MILLWIPVLIFAYIKMIDPGEKRKHLVLNVKYYAHRGFHGEEGIPENSMAAFKKAKGSIKRSQILLIVNYADID